MHIRRGPSFPRSAWECISVAVVNGCAIHVSAAHPGHKARLQPPSTRNRDTRIMVNILESAGIRRDHFGTVIAPEGGAYMTIPQAHQR